MIRPSSLIRTCDTMPEIVANANNICKESLDCGINAIGWCSSISCQKKATPRNYLITLAFVGILLGSYTSYFNFTARQVAEQFQIDAIVIDWLLVTNGIVQGFTAIIIAYWGNRIHRISWLGFILLIHSIMASALLIPTIVHLTDGLDTISSVPINILCVTQRIEQSPIDRPHGPMTLALLFILQIGNGLSYSAFIALGLSYLDDNVQAHNSPTMIATAYASIVLGVQLGYGLAFLVKQLTPFNWWFGWSILSPVLFTLAILISLFPRRLMSSLVRDAANEIIGVATNSSQASLGNNQFLANFTFWSSIKRIFRNKILVINSIATVFIQTAIVNYSHYETSYMESRFFFPSSNFGTGEWTSKIITSLLKPPIVALTIILSGFVISKINPKPRTLVLWNVVIGVILVLIFVIFIFLDCNNGTIAGTFRGKLQIPYCASQCISCPDDIPFSPVCPNNSVQTYYSPCHAGCSAEFNINNLRVFNCTCGINSEVPPSGIRTIATEGGCRIDECQVYWIIFQGLTVLAAAILGAGLIANFLIQIRSVLPQDKALALSLELTLIGIFVYIPGRIGFSVVYDSTCQLWNNNKCYLNESPKFGNILNIMSIALITVGTLFNLLLVFMVGDLQLYGVQISSHRSMELLNRMMDNNTNNGQNISNINSEVQESEYNSSRAPLLETNSPREENRTKQDVILTREPNMNNRQTNF